MIFILFGFSLGIVLAISGLFLGWDIEEKLLNFFGGLIVSVIFSFLGFGVGSFIGLFLPTYAKLDQVSELAVLQDNNGMRGSFFLGTGSISSEPVYFYLEKLASGGLVQKSISTSEVILFQDETLPRLITYKSFFEKEWWLWFGIPGGSYMSEIHIPANSVVNEYKVDAK